MDLKNNRKDIFEAINLINTILPRKKYLIKKINTISSGLFVGADHISKTDLPKYNQSSMDGIGISKIGKKYKVIGKTSLTKLNQKKVKENECLIVKTGSFINNSIKKIIPVEDLIKEKNIFHHNNYSKNNFIRKKGHVIKSNTIVFKKGYKLCNKDIQFINNFNNSKIKITQPLSFTLIGTGNEFFGKNAFKPTNIEYLNNFLKINNQIINKVITIKDDQKKLEQLISQSKSNIIIVTGGTGKSDDDFNFQNKKLVIEDLNLKPGKPLKVMKINNKVIMYFPGNPCSNFVLTNILLKGILLKYYSNKQIVLKNFKIKLKYPFNKLKRKSFLFAKLNQNSVKIFDDQESSNVINIIKSNILIYYDNTENIKYIKIYD